MENISIPFSLTFLAFLASKTADRITTYKSYIFGCWWVAQGCQSNNPQVGDCLTTMNVTPETFIRMNEHWGGCDNGSYFRSPAYFLVFFLPLLGHNQFSTVQWYKKKSLLKWYFWNQFMISTQQNLYSSHRRSQNLFWAPRMLPCLAACAGLPLWVYNITTDPLQATPQALPLTVS